MKDLSKRTAAIIVFVAMHVVPGVQLFAQPTPVTVVIVRHPESASDQPTIPLTPAGRQRADLEAGHAKPIVMIESRYRAGWIPTKHWFTGPALR
jgi:hypothetical protein